MLRDPVATCFRSARDAIRWLERELERGHKGIRAQERAEVGSLPWPAPTRRQEGRSRYEVKEYRDIGTALCWQFCGSGSSVSKINWPPRSFLFFKDFK
jgi:hypothetical protein